MMPVGQLCKLRGDFIGAARTGCSGRRGRLETGLQDVILPHLLLALLVAALPLPAQQPLPQEAPGAKFQASSQLVVEIVSVKDKRGKIIEGLTAKDFTVTENGVA